MQKADGMNYAPVGRSRPVCGPGDFRFGVIGLDHGHINGMTNGLREAGGQVALAWDNDSKKLDAYCRRYPEAKQARSEAEVLDADVQLIACAAVPSQRAAVGLRAISAGKDFFSDKAPFTKMEQLEAARLKVKETHRIWAVYYSEHVHVEAAVLAGDLVSEGAIGKVVHVLSIAPHRLNAQTRPNWFFERDKYGGILCDLGIQQMEQILFYSGADDAKILHSKVGNYGHPQYPELEDFGDVDLLTDNNVSAYLRVDWFTPNGLGCWGDARVFIAGTEGYIETRKYIDVARDAAGDHVYLVNGQEERHISAEGSVGYPFFGRLILDSLQRTRSAMSQEHVFKAAELALTAQANALRIEGQT